MLVPLSSLSGLRIASSADPPQPVCPCVRVSCPSSTALPAPCSLLLAPCPPSLPPARATPWSRVRCCTAPTLLLERLAAALRKRMRDPSAAASLAHAAVSLMLLSRSCCHAPMLLLLCVALRCAAPGILTAHHTKTLVQGHAHQRCRLCSGRWWPTKRAAFARAELWPIRPIARRLPGSARASPAHHSRCCCPHVAAAQRRLTLPCHVSSCRE